MNAAATAIQPPAGSQIPHRRAPERRVPPRPVPSDDDVRHLKNGQEMAINRLVLSILFGVYLVATGSEHASLITEAVFLIFSGAVFYWLRWQPGRMLNAILAAALVADLCILSLGMHLDGSHNAALFPLYLWVIQGNGFRFGLKSLFLGMIVAFAGFAAVVASTPYWRGQPALSSSLLAALVVLPTYSSTLIRKLSRARLQAEEASRAKSMFLAAISHELRTPLNAIFGSLSLVEGTPLNEEQRSLFDAMRAGTQALLSLIGNVLDFSRVEAGLMPVKHEPLELGGLLVEIRGLVAIQARLKSLQLCIHLAEDVPPRILGDRKHLFEILLNFTANAVKFTESGSICLSVERVAPGPGNRPALLRFEVSDTGIGIALDAQQRIFEVFSQADSSILDSFGGTGLGLAISQRLVTLMKGEIGVESRPGQGSRFWFTVDLEEAAADAPPPEAAGAALLLCDDPEWVETIAAGLLARNFEVRRIEQLQQALDIPDGRRNGEILFLHRRDPDLDLLRDCALLDRLDPQALVPRILLSPPRAPALPRALLKRHFITTLTLPGSELAWARAHRLAAAAAPRTTTPSIVTESADIRTGMRPLQVLVADDNEINRRVVGKILERYGHQVWLVEDGIQAMDAMEARSFDIVLMDVNMPLMNGMEATRLFRVGAPASPRLPILALTADATVETAQRCIEAGMDGCITKPFTPAHLIAAIDTLVGEATPPAQRAGVERIADHPRFAARLPPLDLEVLAELRTLGGDEFVGELLHSFIADTREMIGRIETAVAARDMTTFRFELHALCSGAANIGATSLRHGTAARDIDRANLDSAGPVLVHWLRRELATLEREWHRIDTQGVERSG